MRRYGQEWIMKEIAALVDSHALPGVALSEFKLRLSSARR